MEKELTSANPAPPAEIRLSRWPDVPLAARSARDCARTLVFPDVDRKEIALAVSELPSNLIRHASGGVLRFQARAQSPPALIAGGLLAALGKPEDDATVIIAREVNR